MLGRGYIIDRRYEIDRLLGVGGMGEVWLALDTTLKRKVAIKTINQAKFPSEKSLSVFYDEAKTGSQLLGHPNVVSSLDFGVDIVADINMRFLVMEYIEGLTTLSFIDDIEPKMDKQTYYNISLLIGYQICKAVSFAHKKNIIHRDIKPLNIFISKLGVAKVGDFGLAKFKNAVSRSYTVQDHRSDGYAAPEQFKGQNFGDKTDIYQLGCTLYHLFTGKLPFECEDALSFQNAHLNQVPEDISKLNSYISPELADLINAMLHKKAEDRPLLWELLDCFENQLAGEYIITVDAYREQKSVIELVHTITDFDLTDLKKNVFKYKFAGYEEVLSKGLQLLAERFYNFSITNVSRKKIVVGIL